MAQKRVMRGVVLLLAASLMACAFVGPQAPTPRGNLSRAA
eukprot:CAMPEP_0181439190 /NCGR_PEP_ID=MMETSP1110-20121109/22300_1 /TAXON_ID=174948 /ORGANISM="Symbiodinium sp., Strain CCMP421" /LENGTH=39 /DNA_ID= /DNA_START= /DNA_END= /DNA_ORIENTATION=